jgi:hypothetical protein
MRVSTAYKKGAGHATPDEAEHLSGGSKTSSEISFD